MQIIELILKNFGKFRDKSITFSEGINLIYGENESGKSTVYTFLKAMLFGMERGRGRAAVRDTFSQYEPWDNPSYYAGVLRFSCGGRTFRLERNFDKYTKSVSLFCEDDGEELSVEQGDLDMLLGGMSEADYENTIAIGQMKASAGMSLAASLKNYAANYYASGNGDLNLDGALNLLKERRKELDREIRSMDGKKQERRDKIELEASYVWREIRRLDKGIDQSEEEWENNRQLWEEKKAQREKQKELEAREGRFAGWRIHPVEIFSMAAAIVLSFILFERPWNFPVMIVVALAEGLYVWNCLKDGRKKRTERDYEADEEERQLFEAAEKQKWKLEQLREEYRDKQIQYGNLQEQLEELNEVSGEFKEQETQRKALELAMNTLKSLSGELQSRAGRRMNERVSEILSAVTKGKYEKVWVDENLHVNLFSQGRKIPMEQVSRGTIEQIYFALRMAAADILYDEEYPVILDETFAYYDDERMKEALNWLAENRKQVIIFSCRGELDRAVGDKIVTQEVRL